MNIYEMVNNLGMIHGHMNIVELYILDKLEAF